MSTAIDDELERLTRAWMAAHPGASNEDLQEAHQNLIPQAQDNINKNLTPGQIAGNLSTPDFDMEGNSIKNKTYVDPGSAEVGGYAGGAKDIHDSLVAASHGNDAAQAANQEAMGQSISNMQQDRDPLQENAIQASREADARTQQGQALDLQRDAALGNAPSVAAYQTQSGMNDIAGGQAGAMGSARGLAAMSGVQGAGASGVGQSAGNLALQGGMGRSGEVGKAIGMYGSSAGDMRGSDLNREDQTNQLALAGSGMNDSWKTGNAGLAAKQGQLAGSMTDLDDAYYGVGQNAIVKQHGYNQEMKAIEAGASADSAAGKRAKSLADTDRTKGLIGGAIQGGLTLVGGGAGAAAGGIANSYINKR